MRELIRAVANGLTQKQGGAILTVATEIGNKLGDFLNDAIDEVFDKVEKAIKENA